jgi:hypothetical protein
MVSSRRVVKTTSTLGGYLLGLVPVGVGLVLGILCLPRSVPPEDVPVPVVNAQALGRIETRDHALGTEPTPLPDDIRALGSAVRAYYAREAKQLVDPYVTPASMNEARTALDNVAFPLEDGKHDDDVLALRATQLEGFLVQVHAFERTGNESAELEALAGPFVRRMREAGWCSDHACVIDDDALRTMYKLAWNGLLHLERPPFTLALDEERALYAFYLRHPHAAEAVRKRIDEARSGARSAKACDALSEAEALGAEQWRIDRVNRLAAIDPSYPKDYALGVLHYRHKDFPAASESFRDWLQAHPDGQWAIRARNYLRASLYESGLQ